MYLVKLNPRLLEVNAQIAAGMADAVTTTPLSGTLHNGYNQATAQIAPGTTGTVTVSFEFVVLSVSSATFDLYRAGLQQMLGPGAEHHVAKGAGIAPHPPPVPASRMASYVDGLFSDLVFGGQAVSARSTPFNATPESTGMLAATRLLDVTQIRFSGTLTASSESPSAVQAAAYVPITAVEFTDGLTIPFAGYSENVLVDDGGLRQLSVPGDFWSELGVGAA